MMSGEVDTSQLETKMETGSLPDETDKKVGYILRL